MRATSFEELEHQWRGMLRRFASWRIPGYEYEDLHQELCVVLYNAQRSYDPNKGAAFITYLYRACLNKVRKLRHQSGALKRIPQDMVVPLCAGDHLNGYSYCATCTELPQVVDNLEVFELLEGVSPEARRVAELSLYGDTSREKWIERGMTPQEIKKGVEELKELLRGGTS